MPIFAYRCQKCNHRFELLVRTPKEDPSRCPECDSEEIKKIFSSFSAISSTNKTSCPASCREICSNEQGGCGGMCPMGG